MNAQGRDPVLLVVAALNLIQAVVTLTTAVVLLLAAIAFGARLVGP